MTGSERVQALIVAALAWAGVGLAPAAARAQCPYSSIQTRVQLNESAGWAQSLTLPQRETFRVAVMRNGTGQLASPSYASVAVTRPDGQVLFPGIGGYVHATVAGTYTVQGACGSLSSIASAVATAGPRLIWGIGPEQADPTNWGRFHSELDKIRDAGATSTHLSFNWDVIEPVQGQRLWEYAEKQVAAARSRGLTPFAYTGSTATWALAAACPQGCPPNCPESCTPASPTPPEAYFPPDKNKVTDFENFHRDLAAAFCGQVRYYEFWNEPNGCGFRTPQSNLCGFPSEKRGVYAWWLKRWYEAMKQGCPNTVLSFGGFECSLGVGPGVDCAGDLDSLYGTIALPGNGCLNNCFDAVALHPYGNHTASNPLNWAVIDAVSARLASHGEAHKLVWLDEWAIANSAANAGLITTGLNGIEARGNAFQARYLTLTDINDPDLPSSGLTASNLAPRASYWAFCNHARTRNTFVPAGLWRGEYFKNTTLSGTAWVREDGGSTLYFNLGTGGPICDFAGNNFSARWTRTFNFAPATYRFTARSDDGVRVWVDGALAIDAWYDHAPTVFTADRTLAAGNHTVRMDYYERTGSATAQLSWPVVSSTVCGNLTKGSCAGPGVCEWFECANLCLPKGTPNPPTCTCAAATTTTQCGAVGSLGCSWFSCKSRCLATGTSTYSVCGTGTP